MRPHPANVSYRITIRRGTRPIDVLTEESSLADATRHFSGLPAIRERAYELTDMLQLSYKATGGGHTTGWLAIGEEIPFERVDEFLLTLPHLDAAHHDARVRQRLQQLTDTLA